MARTYGAPNHEHLTLDSNPQESNDHPTKFFSDNYLTHDENPKQTIENFLSKHRKSTMSQTGSLLHFKTLSNLDTASQITPSALRGSLNYIIKKKEAARIDRENGKIIKSLLN